MDGMAALVADKAVAIFRTYDDEVFAPSSHNPIRRASVLSRGTIGSRLIDGVDDAAIRIPTCAT